MPSFDRGNYEPGEAVRVFDGSEDDEDVEGSRLPLLIVLALLVLAMFGGVVWLAYTQGVARGRTETPVLTAENGPARIAPQNPGGAEQPYKGFKIYEQPAPPDDDTAQAPATAPAPAKSPASAADAKAAAPPIPPPPATKPAIVAPPPPKAVAAMAPPPAKPAPSAAPPAAKPAPIAAPPPAAAATAASAAPLKIGPATAPPRSLGAPAPAKPVAAAPPADAPPVKAAAAGTYMLQIGAYKSQSEADAAWKVYQAKHAALLSGYGPDVQRADLGDKGTWYRLRVGGFADKDVASALCDRLKADQGSCFLSK
jgi:cell division protein FtsN